MLVFIAATQVTSCIVHKLDRLARSRADDLMIHETLINAGVHRSDAFGDARPRHHVVHRGVLQPQPRH
ncbi:recombinase family protein [Micrococcus yunnanensis]|uniref:recombinase family protein n=1 Tax=Micrococcus yunnanensis TaxID=566027 RepID=UPI0021F33190|nr:recombinase family protein [Micrococcus yunnanensis]